jgi:ribosomal-protein-alanine N-acetyltransferase
MIHLETERLLMRPFLPEDAEQMFLLNNNPVVLQYTGDVPFSSPREALQLIERYDQYKKYGLGRLTVLRKDDHAFLGWCGLKYHEYTGTVDLGYRFHQQYWGMGYATEACLANLAFGFSHPNISMIIGQTRKDNVSSIRVLEKIGMRYIKDFLWEGMPSLYYSIIKSKFKAKNLKFPL